MKSSIKIFAINVFVLFVVISAINWTICIGYSAQKAIKDSGISSLFTTPRKSKLPNYTHIKWAKKHFQEFKSLQGKYISYIGWRRKPYSGTTINISGPYMQRRTIGQMNPEKPTVYFFGGSTMWGTGSDDASTIPSQFSQLSGLTAENFGETGFTAHQSLILLIQLLQSGRRPDIVVFYDGVNEVAHKCRAELNEWSHAREARISTALTIHKEARKPSLSYLLRPLKAMADRIVRAVPELGGKKNKNFNCHTDRRKAQKIANNLIQDWSFARELVESYGGKFFGVLQPVSFFSDTRLDHISLGDLKNRQYQTVYLLIRKEVAKQDDFHDFVDLLDRDEYIYIDFCHLSPNGNGYVAEKMVQIVTNERSRSLMESGMNYFYAPLHSLLKKGVPAIVIPGPVYAWARPIINNSPASDD